MLSPVGQGLQSVSLSRATDRRLQARPPRSCGSPRDPGGDWVSHASPEGQVPPACPSEACRELWPWVGGCGALSWGALCAPCVACEPSQQQHPFCLNAQPLAQGLPSSGNVLSHFQGDVGTGGQGSWGAGSLEWSGSSTGIRGTSELCDCWGRASPLETRVLGEARSAAGMGAWSLGDLARPGCGAGLLGIQRRPLPVGLGAALVPVSCGQVLPRAVVPLG